MQTLSIWARSLTNVVQFATGASASCKNMSNVTLRDACYSDLREIAHVKAKAFWDDNLFGQLIHPHRNDHPNDVVLYWLRRLCVDFWDCHRRLFIAVGEDANGREVIVGVAQWVRLGDGGKKMEYWYLDPRKSFSSHCFF
jgi:hypothetical protein